MSTIPVSYAETPIFSVQPAIIAPPLENENAGDLKPSGVGEEILVVDDEAGICELVEKVLTRLGYCVITAGNGEEAVHRYQRGRSKIQLVLTDVVMPGLNGWGVIRAIRTINPDVKIIASSGYKPETLANLPDLKVNAFLAKPYDFKTLIETVQTVLRQSA